METRDKRFLVARPEARVLEWIARRVPGRLKPDHFTALGVLASIGIAAAYVLSNGDSAWLWAASALLVVHWLGDSLDGTLARVRRSERPRYGYYLDHLVDAFATAAIGIGLGLSPYMLLAVGLAIVVAYLILSINTYLETHAFGVFTLGYGRLGPTEARLILVAVNTLLALGLAGAGLLNVLGIGLAAVMIAALVARAGRNLKRLAELEPAAEASAGAQRARAVGHRLEEVGQRADEAAARLALPDLLELGEVLVHHLVDQREVGRPDRGERALVDRDDPVRHQRGVHGHVARDLQPPEQAAHQLHDGRVAGGARHRQVELQVELEEQVLVLEEVVGRGERRACGRSGPPSPRSPPRWRAPPRAARRAARAAGAPRARPPPRSRGSPGGCGAGRAAPARTRRRSRPTGRGAPRARRPPRAS